MNCCHGTLRTPRWFFFLLFSLAFFVWAASLAWGQLAAGQIEGTVSDPSAAVVAEAKVTIRNAATGLERVLTTDTQGFYRAVSLPPGDYTVQAEKSGFRMLERAGIHLDVGTTVTVDLTLALGKTTEVVTVSEEAPLVKSSTSEVSSIIPRQVVQNLPVIGRRWDNFVLLTPGVTPDGTFGLISYRGISGLYNNNTVDGVDNNQAFFSEARGRTRAAYSYSQAAVQEFQVGLSNFSAEFGRAAGGTVNAVTKSGANAFHGEGFYYIRDAKFEAREPTVDTRPIVAAIGQEKPPERRQQFGFAMGGPVKRDKLFWFLNYDQQKRNFPYVVAPSSRLFFANGASDCVKLTGQLLTNCNAVLNFIQAHNTVAPRKGSNWVSLGRLDWQISEKNLLSGYYNYHQWRAPNGIQSPLVVAVDPSNQGFDGVRTDVVNIHLSSNISPTVLNEIRFQFGRDFEFQTPNAPGPFTNITGGISFGMPNFLPRPAFPNEKRWEWIDNFTWIKGQHTVKFGGDINYVRDLQINLFQGGGGYSFNTLTDLAKDCLVGTTSAGCVPTGTRDYNNFVQSFDLRVLGGSLPATQAGKIFFTTTDYNLFAQDTFKVRAGVTLNYGVRYEYQQFPQPTQGNPAFPLTQHINQDTNNFAPRIGLAWDIGNRHRTTLHAAYGLYYGRTGNSAIANALINNAVTVANFFFTPSSPGAPVYPNCFTPATNSPCALSTPTGSGSARVLNVFSSDYARPYIHEAEFEIEQELFPDTVFSITYAFSGGHRLPIFRDTNIPQPGARVFYNVTGPLQIGTRTVFPPGVFGPFPFYCGSGVATCASGGRPVATVGRIIETDSVVNSTYHGLIVRLVRRMHRGVFFDSHFTWSRALDNGESSTTFFAGSNNYFDPLNLRNEHGTSSFDIPKRFVTGFIWQPDQTWTITNSGMRKAFGGWMFSGGVTVSDEAPVPFNINGSLSSGVGALDTSSPNGSGATNRTPFIGRNPFRLPNGFAVVDFRITRSIPVGEGKRFEIIAEAFNLFNRTNFTTAFINAFNLASSSITASCGGISGNATDRCVTLSPRNDYDLPNQASSTLSSPRQFQFAFKFFW